jgi:hypothetical protein
VFKSGGSQFWNDALAAGERGGHWWLSRGARRCNGSKVVSLGMLRLLPCGKELRRGISEVTGVPRRHRRSDHVVRLQARLISFTPRPNLLPFWSFHPPGTILPESCTNHRDQRGSLRRGHRRRGGLNLRSFFRHCTIRMTFRSPDRAVCSAQISNFHVLTY